MTQNCTIRTFQPGDLPRLHEIRAAAYKPVFQSFRDIVGEKIAPIAFASAEKEQGDFLDSICEASSDHDVYVVEQDNQIVAFFALNLNAETKVGELDLNAVHPDHQNEGVGTWMYEAALTLIKDAGMLVATVGTGGDASHAPARRAYEKAGFGPFIPSVWYYKNLGP